MRLKDIQRQRKWMLCQVQIDSISEPTETQFDGFVQSMEVTFAQGSKDVMNYYMTDPAFAVDPTETGKQWYRIKYTGEYLKCTPAQPKLKDDEFEDGGGVDWEKINLGKCRTQIAKSVLTNTAMPESLEDKQKLADKINEWAEFCITGEIENER